MVLILKTIMAKSAVMFQSTYQGTGKAASGGWDPKLETFLQVVETAGPPALPCVPT